MKLFKKMWADQDGGQAAALVATADAARDARDWGTAAAHYRQALDARPELAPIWVQYGHALKESGNVVEARAAYRRALGLAPDVADTHLQMGHAAKLAGALEEAAACYAQALTLAPGHDDALRELHALALRGIRVDMHALRGTWNRAPAMVPADDPVAALSVMLDAARAAATHPANPTNPAHAEAARLAREQLASAVEILRRIDRDALQATRPAGQGAAIVFDATDLIHHFRSSRLPTGIQRVQLELISAACRATDPAHPAPMVCYLGDQGWLEVPGALFAQLCRICLGHGDAPPAAWQQTLMQLDTLMLGSAPMAFPRGAWLVSLGTSWFPEYLLHVRLARQRYGIRYVPFVHDLIPVVMPEHCVDDLVDRFAAWLLGAFAHADRFLVNSESTRRDLEAAAARLGQPLPAGHVEVVRLDADIRKPGLRAPEAANMQGWGWSRQPFVLMLSTVEPRKNHLAAFRAWCSLIDHHGARHVPQLVCVGARGWKNEAALAMLDNDPVLASRVTILSGLADPQVALLLERCLFTLYPSLYEGWGLPVTESLCHGKVPAVSDVASLPEAGGLLADYFDPQSPGELLRVVEKLIFDVPYRRSREQRIAAEFRPRTWQQLGDQIAQAVHRWQGGIGDAQRAAPAPTLAAGRFYPMAAPRRLPLAQGTVVTESLRAGDGWHGVEDWGCWSRPGDSRLALRLADDLADARVRVYLCVRGLPSRATQYRLECGDGPRSEGRLDAGRERWIAIDVDAPPPGQPLELSLHADVHESLGETTQGADARVIGPAVLGVYVCAADDTAARLRLVEAVTLGSLDALAVPAETDRFLLAARQTSQLLAGL